MCLHCDFFYMDAFPKAIMDVLESLRCSMHFSVSKCVVQARLKDLMLVRDLTDGCRSISIQ